ncbi:integrase [Amycolatopsis decaplanina DSM 44594]|uniref:Integrase n=1 Tax=Amycolatopsis decaplanina DSM 44594 TaxID=1284240 RepID=M2YHH1_9PSEU|nr:integrase [Amycolatopsis decaplanina DSM 44594]
MFKNGITWDQGGEMGRHAEFTIATNMPVYFCDPRAPWQRGSNENTNGLLRQYFPKGTDLSGYSQDELDAVADELNDRPRQTLGWLKPIEAFSKVLLD